MSDSVKVFTDDSFDSDVLKSETPVMVDFWAPWCGPCRRIMPMVEEIAEELSGVASVGKVNIDENPGVAQRYGVQSIPTIIIFKDGQIQNTFQGIQAKSRYVEAIEAATA